MKTLLIIVAVIYIGGILYFSIAGRNRFTAQMLAWPFTLIRGGFQDAALKRNIATKGAGGAGGIPARS